MMEEFEAVDKKDFEELNKILDPILNKKKQGSTFRNRLMLYNTPKINVIIGAIFQTLNGLIGPLMGVLIIKALFSMILYVNDIEKMRTEVNTWILLMFIGALVALVLNFISKWMFGIVGENITLNVRRDLYQSIIRKHVGWHDDQENAAGILSSTLASDVQQLNGVSTEGLAVAAEAASSLIGGITLAFIF